MIGVYLIRNKINGKVLVGSSNRSVNGRWFHHLHHLRAGKHGNPHLQAAWREYGRDAFEFIPYLETSFGQAVEAELEVMQLFKSNDSRYGYNIATPGLAPMTGRRHSVETRTRMSGPRGPRPDVAERNAGKRCKGRLTQTEVSQIRSSPMNTKELALWFGITHQYVSKLRLNQRWNAQGNK